MKRATERLEAALRTKTEKERIYTLGTLIHNDTYNRMLAEHGVRVTDMEELLQIAPRANADSPLTVFVRAHGIPRQDEARLMQIAGKNPYFRYEDCTCPYVKKIHVIAHKYSRPENVFVLFGSERHPECVGILSYFDYEKMVFASSEELEKAIQNGDLKKIEGKMPILAAQTTQNLSEWKKSQEIFKKLYTNALIVDTICNVTEARQTEAERLAAQSDIMIVIGGRDSSNTAKLFEICKKICPQTFWIENPEELASCDFNTFAHTKVGIAAGASTPSGVIQEVWKTMSDKNFEELLEESFKTLNTGDIVTGIVTAVSDTELQLDVGSNVTGYIKAEQISDDPSLKLTELYKVGDEIEGRVGRISDIEGIAELSKKAVDSAKNWQKIVDAGESGEAISGKVIDIVKGGVTVLCGACKVFVPASQSGVPKDGDMSVLKGKEVKIKIIEVKEKRAIGSIRAVEREERMAREESFWSSIEEGKVYTGVVKSLTSYGAFVDLGGVDGMVHKTELSWRPISKPADVVSVGDEITVFVKSFDAEKKRISLGYKTEESNPWYVFRNQFEVGDVASVKIVNMMPFGAFAEIVEGVDGLIHISQIAQEKIGKPADVLTLGQVVDAKIIGIDEENRKISLSIRALLDEAQAAAEAMPEEFSAETAEEVTEVASDEE